MAIQKFLGPPPRSGPVLQQDGTFQLIWQRFFGFLASAANANLGSGVSGSVVLHGSTNGSLTFTNGVVTSAVAPAGTTGFTGTITTAKLTALGANGSMTFTNGILTSQVAAT